MWRSSLHERAASLALCWLTDRRAAEAMACRLRASPSCQNGYQKLGRLGKKNLKIILEEKRAIHWPSLLLLLAACHSELSEPLQSGKVLAWEGLQGRWAGPVVPESSDCGPPARGLMSIGARGFAFDPFQGATVINGEVAKDGHLSGRLVRQNGDRQDLSITFEGAASASDVISGALRSGRCRWTVTLRRA